MTLFTRVALRVSFFLQKKPSSSILNDTYREKTVFYSIQCKNGCLAASDFFNLFTQTINPLSRIKEYGSLKNVIHQINSKGHFSPGDKER